MLLNIYTPSCAGYSANSSFFLLFLKKRLGWGEKKKEKKILVFKNQKNVAIQGAC
jgi:hypothetical protein